MDSTEPNVLPLTVAADEKGVHRTTIHRAIDRGEINTVQVGQRRFVARDETFEDWTPQRRENRANEES